MKWNIILLVVAEVALIAALVSVVVYTYRLRRKPKAIEGMSVGELLAYLTTVRKIADGRKLRKQKFQRVLEITSSNFSDALDPAVSVSHSNS